MEHELPTLLPTRSSHSPVAVWDTSRLRKGTAREPNNETRLRQALRDWAIDETTDWDSQVEASATGTVGDTSSSDLWDSMPTLDSKAVARSSPIFEQYLGRPLDIRLIRPGGYQSIDDLIDHLVPAMMMKVS